ncbi:MAG: hypothetical protein KC912_12165 [Proteobacteria bacterium]|nr:hypothetical protein [Pseudomonadota bacterium]
MTGRDALLSSEHAELVRYAVPLLRGADFARYYAVDAAGKVVRSYEEASLSYDGDLMSWAFSVVDGALWKFSTNAEEPLFGVSTRSFSKRCVLDGLTDAR